MRASNPLLAMLLLVTGCASVTHAPGRGGTLSYTPVVVTRPSMAEESSDQHPHSITGPKMQQRMWRHIGPRNDATVAGPGIQGAVGGKGQDAALPRQAVLKAIDNLKVSVDDIGDAFSRFAARPPALGSWGLNDMFVRHIDHGSNQLRWLHGALGSATALAEAASEVGDSSTELGILRMSGPRLQAVLFGTQLLATWFDFLQLADAASRYCLMCSSEKMFVVLHRVKGLMDSRLAEFASLDPERVEAAATAMPELMGELTREFDALHRDTRATMKTDGKVMAAVQALEMLTLISTLKMSLPRQPPSAPATLGLGLVMSSGGVMAGSRIVVSAEWVEMMRRLVQAGIISVPVISSAVRIHGGQVLMTQAHQDLPQGVRDALGDSPEVRGMRVTDKAGAGMSAAPKHHVMPNEHREWFEQRGFTGDLDIDNFCVRLERSHHEAIHGGGSWRLGRTWPGEWNRMIMETLRDAEAEAGRRLTRNTILRIVGENMNRYYIPMNFTPGRR